MEHFLPPACRGDRRSPPYEVEIEPVNSAEWLRECWGFLTSFFVHMLLILVLAVAVTPTERHGAVITIISQPSADDRDLDFAEFESPDFPIEPPNPLHEQANAEAPFAEIDIEISLDAASQFSLVDPVPSPPTLDGDGGFDSTDMGSGLSAIGQETKGDGLDAKGIGAKVQFYGVKATGRRFVFVTDCSSSMQGEPLQRLKEQLRKSIGDLPAKAEFYVVFFNDRAMPMPSAACVQAAPRHVRTYLEWVDQVQSTGGTDPSQAMNIALALKPSVVFLLTDGMFQPGPTEAVIGSLNKDRKVQINTIAIGERGSEPALRRIAKENKGTYTFVPNR